MHHVIARNWWTLALRGVLALIFGLAALLWPEASVNGVAVLFGLYAVGDGVLAFASGLLRPVGATRPWWSLMIEGFVGLGLGIAAFSWPGMTLTVLTEVIAAWAVLSGIFSLLAAQRMRQDVAGEWLLGASGVLAVLLGLTLTIAPAVTLLAVLSLVGVYAVVFGGVLVALGLRLRYVAHIAMLEGRAGTVPVPEPAPRYAEELPGARSAPAWGAVIAGAIVALASFFVIDTLGAALGLSMSERITGENLAASSVAWMTLSVVVALFFGGWFMARLIGLESAGQAWMHGTLLWGVVFAGLMVFATSGVVTGLSTVMGVPEPSVDALENMDLDDNGLPTTLSTVLANPLAKSAAWWAFGGMMASLVATIGGAAAGRRAVVHREVTPPARASRMVAWGRRVPAS
jgi:uncharacterized membrane protein HdeD (DUF308 family)